MKKTFKFISRLIVGIALILWSLALITKVATTVVWPKLPLVKGAEYIQDVSGSMGEPDKGYARNAISKASRENKIAITLDYQLTTFAITDSYIDKTIGNVVDNIYRNQPYVIYTYFADTDTLVITTNIDDTASDVVDKNKEGIDSDAKVVKEILYYQQNLKKSFGLKCWNFNLNTEAMRNTCLSGVGFIILLILGIGVLPTESRIVNPFRRKKTKHSSQPTTSEQ